MGDGTFELQRVLRAKDFRYVLGLVQRDEVLSTIGMDGKTWEPKAYHLDYAMRGSVHERVLAIAFHRQQDPVIVFWYVAKGKDWTWILGEEYDADFDSADLSEIVSHCDDLPLRIAEAKRDEREHADSES